MLFLAILSTPYHWNRITPSAWTGLAYVVVVSMFVAFIFWYRGLAQGGIAKIAQLQLLQPFFGLLLSSLFLDKTITWSMIATALAIVGCMTGAKRFT